MVKFTEFLILMQKEKNAMTEGSTGELKGGVRRRQRSSRRTGSERRAFQRVGVLGGASRTDESSAVMTYDFPKEKIITAFLELLSFLPPLPELRAYL